jgi:hypothetical protein
MHGLPDGRHLRHNAGGLCAVHVRLGLRLELGLEHVRHLHGHKRAGEWRRQWLHLQGSLLRHAHDDGRQRMRGLPDGRRLRHNAGGLPAVHVRLGLRLELGHGRVRGRDRHLHGHELAGERRGRRLRLQGGLLRRAHYDGRQRMCGLPNARRLRRNAGGLCAVHVRLGLRLELGLEHVRGRNLHLHGR